MSYIFSDVFSLLTNPFLLIPIGVAAYFCKSQRNAAIYGAIAGIVYLLIWFTLISTMPALQSVVLAILIGIVLTSAIVWLKFKRRASKST